MNKKTIVRAAGVIATAATAVLGSQSIAQAHDSSHEHSYEHSYEHSHKDSDDHSHESSTVYVAAEHGGGDDCHHPDASTVQQGVDMVSPGGTVVVCRGTYRESVTITKQLTLQGEDGAVIDATGRSYGIGIGADRVTVTGLTVKNAGVGVPGAPQNCGAPPASPTAPPNPLCAGIVTFAVGAGGPTPGNHLRIVGNELTGNVGFGIDVVSTHDSLIKDNEANGNGIGLNVVDDLGIPVQQNWIADNEANDNRNGCGIALASHSGAGVIRNVVEDNEADGNGLPAGGAGILLATPTPGGIVRDNQLVDNSASGNGHAGIEVHIHVPNAVAGGNSIVGNRIGENNTGGDYKDMHTTGIYLGSNSPMEIVVRDNRISHDFYGIFQAGPHVRAHLDDNSFRDVTHPFASIPDFM